MKGIFSQSTREVKESLENKIIREKGGKNWLENLAELGKDLLGIEKTASAVSQPTDVIHPDKEASVVNGLHYFGGARKIANTKDRKMEYVIASGKELIGEKLGALKLTGAKALFLKADIEEWDEETNQPLEGTLSFDVAFQAPTGDPRTVSATVAITKGQPQEPSYFSDGVGKKYAFDAKGIEDLLTGTDFEIMQNPKIERENTFFENPGHLANRGAIGITKVGGAKGLTKTAGISKVATAREGLVRKISEEEKGKDASMRGLFGAGRFPFKKREPSNEGGNYKKEDNIPYAQNGANENDEHMASKKPMVMKKAEDSIEQIRRSTEDKAKELYNKTWDELTFDEQRKVEDALGCPRQASKKPAVVKKAVELADETGYDGSSAPVEPEGKWQMSEKDKANPKNQPMRDYLPAEAPKKKAYNPILVEILKYIKDGVDSGDRAENLVLDVDSRFSEQLVSFKGRVTAQLLVDDYLKNTEKYNQQLEEAGALNPKAGLKRKAVDGEIDSDILNVEQHLDVNEFRDFQNLQKVSDDMWTVIREREKLNEGKGLPSYTNIDYSDIKLVDKQIQDYVDQAKQRVKTEEKPEGEEDVAIEEPEVPEKPEEKEEKPKDKEKEVPESVLDVEKGKGKPALSELPEFASAKTKMQRKAWGANDPNAWMPNKPGKHKCLKCGYMFNAESMADENLCKQCAGGSPDAGAMDVPKNIDMQASLKRKATGVEEDTEESVACPQCGKENMCSTRKSYDNKSGSTISWMVPRIQKCVDCGEEITDADYQIALSNTDNNEFTLEVFTGDVQVNDLTKQATTSWDFPKVCENCKSLVIPKGYSELTEIDMHRKPFCGAISQGNGIGFEFAHFRECKGYDPITKEITQEVEKNVYNKPYQLHRKEGGQTERLMVKKANMAKLIAERKAQATEIMSEIAEEATGEVVTAHPECAKCKDCIPAGEGHVAHDYCKVWQTACTNVTIMSSGACVPISMASQSSETLQKSTSQFSRGQEV